MKRLSVSVRVMRQRARAATDPENRSSTSPGLGAGGLKFELTTSKNGGDWFTGLLRHN
ncbi:MAG: hypothetical protein AB7H90_17410 [Alphaproteobacteria bacterium]